MGRKRRQVAEPCCYPITQRCQERRFLLARELDRRNYVKRLRERLGGGMRRG
jgi:REP element-mobilizing transposase RayT